MRWKAGQARASQKAVSDAERKAHELISTERPRWSGPWPKARRQASEDASLWSTSRGGSVR